jgi:type II secretory pathway predicted ATPase ExeA
VVYSFILHHLELAGAKHTIFSDTSIQAIASLSRGWPRLINKLATHSLLAGCQAKKDLIDEEVVRLAATESGI